MLVFTYGTLKTGQPNHGRMQNQKPGQCIFIGRGVTLDKYPLVVATDYHAPFLLYKPGTGHNIEGEIYEVGDECLDFLDKLEHHPEFYTRLHTEVRVFTGSKKEGQIKQCSAYFLINFREHLLDLPMHACYTDGIDGKRFAFPSGWKTSARPLHEVHKDFEPPDC